MANVIAVLWDPASIPRSHVHSREGAPAVSILRPVRGVDSTDAVTLQSGFALVLLPVVWVHAWLSYGYAWCGDEIRTAESGAPAN